jgi:hypothetical protein
MAAALLLLVPFPETRHTLARSLAIERTDALQGHAGIQHRGTGKLKRVYARLPLCVHSAVAQRLRRKAAGYPS